HGRAEAGAARLEAIDRDDEEALPPRDVVAIAVSVAHEDAVLDRDRMQLAGTHADERERRLVQRLLLHARESVVVPARAPEAEPRREEPALPRVRPDGVPEQRVVLSAAKPVRACFLLVRPARRERPDAGEVVVDDRAVPDGRAEHAIAARSQRPDQPFEAVDPDDGGARRVHGSAASLAPRRSL